MPEALAALRRRYEGRGVQLARVGEGWAFRTAADLGFLMSREVVETRKLSRAAIETLAIVAYHQPVTRAEIEEIRGVSISGGTLDQLIEMGWVKLGRRKMTPGRPMTFVVTQGLPRPLRARVGPRPARRRRAARGGAARQPAGAGGGAGGEAEAEEAAEPAEELRGRRACSAGRRRWPAARCGGVVDARTPSGSLISGLVGGKPDFRVEVGDAGRMSFRAAEVLGELQALALVVRAGVAAVEDVRALGHALVDEAADDLAVVEREGGLVAADLEDAARAGAAGLGVAEAGVEEAGVVDAELADHGEVGGHLGGVVGGDVHRLAADEDVEGAGVEDDAAVAGGDRLPVVGRVVVADAVEVDEAGVRLGAVADEAVPRAARGRRRRRGRRRCAPAPPTRRSRALRRAERGVVEGGVAAGGSGSG